MEQVRASVRAELPSSAGQIEAVRDRFSALSAQVEQLQVERDAARADARQLARLVRHLFLTTGAEGFARPGIQALLATHLTAADRGHVPGAHAGAEPPATDAAGAVERRSGGRG